jgi:hypothetical protein
MPLSPAQLQECLRAVGAFIEKRRPPAVIRDQVDFRADISGSEVIIVEVRPRFDDKHQKIERPVARAKWIATRKKWRLYRMRADLKWHDYQPLSEAATLDLILSEVHRDPHGCFFG